MDYPGSARRDVASGVSRTVEFNDCLPFADCFIMAPAAVFAEVLDACVDRFGSGEPVAAKRWHLGIATRPFFSFAGASPAADANKTIDERRAGSTGPAESRRLRLVHPSQTTAAGAPRRADLAGPPRPVPRPARTLTPRQQDALDQFIALGARVSADFTRDELRTAFRSLARAYHPDRHPGIGASEKARLSSKFALVRGAYELLRRP